MVCYVAVVVNEASDIVSIKKCILQCVHGIISSMQFIIRNVVIKLKELSIECSVEPAIVESVGIRSSKVIKVTILISRCALVICNKSMIWELKIQDIFAVQA
jgi:hypothetical protein